MRVLVVGGAGYIGSVSVERFLDAGHEVVVLDDLSRGHRGAVDSRARLVVGDFGDREILDEVLGGSAVDAVLHCAALSIVSESVEFPQRYRETNVEKGQILIDALLRHGVGAIVFSSTAAVYGEPAQMPISEDAPLRPMNPYGETKLKFEEMLREPATARRLRSVCFRYFNAAGASEKFGEDHRPETHLIPIVLEVAAGRREKVSIFGNDYPTRDGTCVRDYIHVEDIARAHLLGLERLVAREDGHNGEHREDGRDRTDLDFRTAGDVMSAREGSGEVYNLGNGAGFSVLEILEAAERVTGRKIARDFQPRRAGDPVALVASAEKARRELGWEPAKAAIEIIISDAWNWMANRPNYSR